MPAAMKPDELLPLVYEELRRVAARRMAGESPGQTLQATALVHEAWLRLGGDRQPAWDNHGHFIAAATTDNQVPADRTVCSRVTRRASMIQWSSSANNRR